MVAGPRSDLNGGSVVTTPEVLVIAGLVVALLIHVERLRHRIEVLERRGHDRYDADADNDDGPTEAGAEERA